MINKQYSIKRLQTGSALIIGLTILLVMLILGTAGMRTTIMEERMAGNVRDYNTAFQAAELGLVDGEQDVRNTDPITNEPLRPGIFPADDDFSTNCINTSISGLDGLCRPSSTYPPQWSAIAWNADPATVANVPFRRYGQYTKLDGSTPPSLPGLPTNYRLPRYIIEYLGEGPGSLGIGGAPRPANKYYRITAQGYGVAMSDNSEPLARVMLQSTYGK